MKTRTCNTTAMAGAMYAREASREGPASRRRRRRTFSAWMRVRQSVVVLSLTSSALACVS